MSLMKKRVLSEKQKAAVRANGARSRGIATPDGRERMRAANLRHGLFSQAPDTPIPALGENPEGFEELRRGLYDSWPGADPALVDRQAAAMLRLARADRAAEDLEIRLANAWYTDGLNASTSSDEATLARNLS